MQNSNILNSYIILTGIYLLFLLLQLDEMAVYLKPVIIPILLYAVVRTSYFRTKSLLLSALLFSWMGDIVLIFAGANKLFFIVGLLAFLIAHILYCRVFMIEQKNTHNKTYRYYLPFVALYLIAFISFLWSSLHDLKIPVLLYATVISIMLVLAIKGKYSWKNTAGNYIMVGAIFFVASDSLLAINKFYHPFIFSSFCIMATYIIAQACIVFGLLTLHKKAF